MNRERFQTIADRYPLLRLAVVGDFCLDRYLEIDPARREISIETGLPVHNVVNIRSQPGAAGTILNNLVALGIGALFPVGFTGQDGEGFELRRALLQKSGVNLDFFLETSDRRTFTYCKPLVVEPGKPPVELSRLDSKNWTPTSDGVQERIIASVRELAGRVDAIILMDQVDVPETGVVTARLLQAMKEIAQDRLELLILADSRRGLRGYPPVCLKMNSAELSSLTGMAPNPSVKEVAQAAAQLSVNQARHVFITLAEQGMVGASPSGQVEHVPALPVRGKIDVVGAGDAVTANLAASLAAGASLRESLGIANVAASLVLHQLGTTGTASPLQIGQLLASSKL